MRCKKRHQENNRSGKTGGLEQAVRAISRMQWFESVIFGFHSTESLFNKEASLLTFTI